MLAMVRKRKSRGALKPSRVGVNLRHIRDTKNLGQEEVAQAAGLHRVTISNIESGAQGTVEVDTLISLAEAVGVRPSELLGADAEHAPVEPLIKSYLASPLAMLGKPTEDELEWLRSRPSTFWLALKPNPEVIHYVLMAHRAEAKPAH